MFTSPLPTEPVVDVCEKGSTVYTVIFPVVCFEEVSRKTWSAAERNQFCWIAWSGSAEVTSSEKLCGFPSVNSGTKGVTSTK